MSYAHRHPSPYHMTTIKELALRAMRRGPIDRTPDGWLSRAGYAGKWNTHTITYLAMRGLCAVNRTCTVATITEAGNDWLQRRDM